MAAAMCLDESTEGKKLPRGLATLGTTATSGERVAWRPAAPPTRALSRIDKRPAGAQNPAAHAQTSGVEGAKDVCAAARERRRGGDRGAPG